MPQFAAFIIPPISVHVCLFFSPLTHFFFLFSFDLRPRIKMKWFFFFNMYFLRVSACWNFVKAACFSALVGSSYIYLFFLALIYQYFATLINLNNFALKGAHKIFDLSAFMDFIIYVKCVFESCLCLQL